MTQYEWDSRHARIPEPIRAVAMTNPIVHRICDEFAAGHIVTWEEALSQMVVRLATQSEHLTEQAIKLSALSIPPIVIPKENFK